MLTTTQTTAAPTPSTTTAPTSSSTTAPTSSYTAPTSSYTAPTSSTTTAPTTLLCNPTTLQPPIKKKWQRGPRQKCCFPKCEYNERTDPKIKRITNLPKNQPPLDIGRLRDVKRFLKKKWERQLTLQKCGKKDKGAQYFLCSHHEMHEVTKRITITRKTNIKNQPERKCPISFTFTVPTGIGIKAAAQPTRRHTKGLGNDRGYKRLLNEMKHDIIQHNDKDTNKYHNLVNIATGNTDLVLDVVAKNDELEAECTRLRKENEDYKKREKEMLEKPSLHTANRKKGNAYVLPVVSFEDLVENDAEVKRRTGFSSLKNMISFIIILCNGDFNQIRYKHTSLTWLEEWFFYFEWIWGRTLLRWIDAAAVYKTHVTSVRKIFEKKLEIAKQCRERWPRYASYHEDHSLTKQKWQDKFKGKRIVMWDDTNINLNYKPSSAEEQRLTYSVYYAGNCAKGGVFIQLCGWIGVENLWCGATSDSHYQEHTKIFERQNDFAKKDLVDGQVKPFWNVLDKGYRVNVPAWRAGRQEIVQPVFASSDRRFSGRDTIITADVATYRSSNERGVKVTKYSAYIARGIKQNASAATMDDVWVSWSFQTNFMYKSVL